MWTRKRDRPKTGTRASSSAQAQTVPSKDLRDLDGCERVCRGSNKTWHERFKELVNYTKDDVIFKNEEMNGADRIMSKRCEEKLTKLAILVANQWHGMKLRVTEAWDDQDHHAKESLHYEGRAVDITTSDRDRSKYGQLAGLAVEAGFDWVFYESRGHVHCSVKSDSSISAKMGGCFPSHSMVQTEDGGKVAISNLSVGQMVLALTSDGNLRYSPVIGFFHRSRIEFAIFVVLTTENGTKMALTPSHLIYAARGYRTAPLQLIFSGELHTGDYVGVVSNCSTVLLERVTLLNRYTDVGVYAPLTRDGTIVIDDVIASCYAIINSHSTAHFSMLPVRIAYETWNLVHGIFGLDYTSLTDIISVDKVFDK